MIADTLARRYRALCALAEDQAGTPEGDTAAAMAAAMLARCPDLELRAEPPEARIFACRHEPDRVLLGRVAAFVGVDAYRIGRKRGDGKGTRWREGLELGGPAQLLDLAGDLYEIHRARVDELIRWTVIGYAAGAMPIEQDRSQTPGDRKADPVAPDLLDAALAGLKHGRGAQASRDTPRGLLTTGEDW